MSKIKTIDTIESLEATDIAHKAIDVANCAIGGTKANKEWSFPKDPDKAKFTLAKYKAAISALNTANSIIKTKIQVLKLTGLDDKMKALKTRGKKL